jgi:hypothetical protein
MVLVNASGQMLPIALLTGLTTDKMVSENMCMTMDNSILVNGQMVR